MFNKLNSNKEKVYLISLIVIIIDQISKLIIKNTMVLGTEIKIIPNFFSILYLTNTGAAFSTLQNQTLFLVLISIICIVLIINLLKNEKEKIPKYILGILLGGMVSNLIDRIFYKSVIDFISFTFINYKFPVFNIADICITLGVIIYIIINFLEQFSKKYKK